MPIVHKFSCLGMTSRIVGSSILCLLISSGLPTSDASQSGMPECSRLVPIPGSGDWFFGPKGPFDCSTTGAQMCDNQQSCCCPISYKWMDNACASCRLTVEEAWLPRGHHYNSIVVSVTPSFSTGVTCAAVTGTKERPGMEALRNAEHHVSMESCQANGGCVVHIQDLLPTTVYTIWCISTEGGTADISPPNGYYLATGAVPLKWSVNNPTFDSLNITIMPEAPSKVACNVRDIIRGTLRRVERSRDECTETGCAMGVHMLVPNSPYEIQCASVGSAQTIPMSDHPITMTTKSAPIQMASIQASSMDSVTMHVTTKGSTDILCALFRELDSHNNGTSGVESPTDPSYKADNQPVLKAPGSDRKSVV